LGYVVVTFKQYLDNSDSDDGEEWDRHEAFHDDVTSQERNKERLFEEEIEIKWEKGGSGLVFYTGMLYNLSSQLGFPMFVLSTLSILLRIKLNHNITQYS